MSDRIIQQANLDAISNNLSAIHGELERIDINVGTGKIIQHFKKGEPLLHGMEKARGIAIRGGYAFIEVYAECCRAVSEDGTVSVIPC